MVLEYPDDEEPVASTQGPLEGIAVKYDIASPAMTSFLIQLPGCVANVDTRNSLMQDGDIYGLAIDDENTPARADSYVI